MILLLIWVLNGWFIYVNTRKHIQLPKYFGNDKSFTYKAIFIIFWPIWLSSDKYLK